MDINIRDIMSIAKEAGDKVLEIYNTDYAIEFKGGDPKNPLTKADLASEKIIKNGLAKYAMPILSEESIDDVARLDSEYVWIVDPLDGTSDFVEKTGEFAIMIGLVKNKRPILGVVYEPAFGRFYFAQAGRGAYSEQKGETKKLHVSSKNQFSEMAMLLSRNHLSESDIKLGEDLKIGKQIKRGSTAKMCVIASGDAEIYVNTSNRTGEWDTCSVELILEEAGGTVTDMDGQQLIYNKATPKNENGFIASNGTMHAEIIKKLKNIAKEKSV